MAVYRTKHYDFRCECGNHYNAMMTSKDAGHDGNFVPEGTKCPKCDALNMPYVEETGQKILIGTHGGVKGYDWQKGLDSGWKDFMKEFKKRHRGNNIET